MEPTRLIHLSTQKVHQNPLKGQTTGPNEQSDQFVYNLYNLTKEEIKIVEESTK